MSIAKLIFKFSNSTFSVLLYSFYSFIYEIFIKDQLLLASALGIGFIRSKQAKTLLKGSLLSSEGGGREPGEQNSSLLNL